jgi:hypothetical protein
MIAPRRLALAPSMPSVTASVVLAWLAGCYSPPPTRTLRVELPEELAGRGRELRVLPQIAEARRELGRGVVALALKRESGKISLTLPGACPLVLDTRKLRATSVSLEPLFRLGPTERVVGLGQRFTLVAEPACREAEQLQGSFGVVGGAPLMELQLASDGRRLTATTSSAAPLERPPGVVAVSAREARELRSELAFEVRLADGSKLTKTLFVSALARSSGLSSVGLTHPVLLGGDGWRLLEKPPSSASALRSGVGFAELVPDLPGSYRLRDALEHELVLKSRRYDQTPLDCGRVGCHVEIAASAQLSPMTRVLESDLGGCHELGEPGCAVACHTTGEPGTRDGGFSDAMQELGLATLPSDYAELPRALRRLGGVGCLACHGPLELPHPEPREHLLGNEICAVCHDAPPRYGHVMALEASRMGHADSLPETRSEPCARCHTAWGALGRAAPTTRSTGEGITCVTCHDVHPRSAAGHGEASASLLRELPLPESLGPLPASFRGKSRVCVGCHTPSPGATLPESSAAAIVAGRGGHDPASGAALELAAPHAASERGCLSCHDSGPERLVMGKTHGFVANEEACSRCHASARARDPSLGVRARRLLDRLTPSRATREKAVPWHARPRALPRSPQAVRALQNALLVLEDPAADVHNPAYAKLLLDSAEAVSEKDQ